MTTPTPLKQLVIAAIVAAVAIVISQLVRTNALLIMLGIIAVSAVVLGFIEAGQKKRR